MMLMALRVWVAYFIRMLAAVFNALQDRCLVPQPYHDLYHSGSHGRPRCSTLTYDYQGGFLLFFSFYLHYSYENWIWMNLLVQAKAYWEHYPAGACNLLNSRSNLVNTITAFVLDSFFVALMLVGLFRRRNANRNGIWGLLVNHELLWFILATIAEVPPLIFLSLNLNG